MIFGFAVLSVILCITTFSVWRRHSYIELKANLVALTLGITVFNLLVGLLVVFDFLESSPDNLASELLRHPRKLVILMLCLLNGLFYSVFTFLFLTSSGRPKKEV
jgi:hypothetical protein